MPVPDPARLAGAFATLAVATAVALPAGAAAASPAAASGSGKSAGAVKHRTTARRRCGSGEVAVRTRGKVRCLRTRGAGGGSPAKPGTAPKTPSLSGRTRPAGPTSKPPAGRSLFASSWEELQAQIQGNTYVGGAPIYYRQSCSGWWWESGYAIRRCWSSSNKVGYSRYEWDFWNGYGWQTYAWRECVAGVCG
jgi:hypothetical protein